MHILERWLDRMTPNKYEGVCCHVVKFDPGVMGKSLDVGNRASVKCEARRLIMMMMMLIVCANL